MRNNGNFSRGVVEMSHPFGFVELWAAFACCQYVGSGWAKAKRSVKKSDDIVTTFTPEKKEKIIVTKEVTI